MKACRAAEQAEGQQHTADELDHAREPVQAQELGRRPARRKAEEFLGPVLQKQ
jgi:hypothetical protein